MVGDSVDASTDTININDKLKCSETKIGKYRAVVTKGCFTARVQDWNELLTTHMKTENNLILVFAKALKISASTDGGPRSQVCTFQLVASSQIRSSYPGGDL